MKLSKVQQNPDCQIWMPLDGASILHDFPNHDQLCSNLQSLQSRINFSPLERVDRLYLGVRTPPWRAYITRCQFHKHFMCTFYTRRSQKCQMTPLTWLSFFAHFGSTCIKAVCRTLMKLSPGVNFTKLYFIHSKSWRCKVFGEKIAVQFHQQLKLQFLSFN